MVGAGSSPLARGLLFPSPTHPPTLRIIPARAGFTPHRARAPTWPGDHPRSRGVYTVGLSPHGPYSGSSPLARGLLIRRELAVMHLRIIPARAGFTAPGPWRPGRRRDHPRSRGVYAAWTPALTARTGSSPLARGLLNDRLDYGDCYGIIPARAGFTTPRPGPGGAGLDHPRSRGVYDAAAAVEADEGRIIPARAGFTRQWECPLSGARDHPRSRGVYRPQRGPRRSPGGSSPLARGLRCVLLSDADGGGIIPARAGFTAQHRLHRRQGGDHPRSRGVYDHAPRGDDGTGGSSPLARGLRPKYLCADHDDGIIPARAGFTPGGLFGRLAGAGSSPLARGLPAAYQRKRPGRRIIPARAGFTRRRPRHRRRRADHPRSRGVYGRAAGQRPHPRRIIPARAGFTSPRGPGPGACPDHPRSRGVYRPGAGGPPAGPGSSPLARGLLGRPAGRLDAGRIIPARAGFTPTPPPPRGGGWDHPRSRGVYRGHHSRRGARLGSSPLARGLPNYQAGMNMAAGIIPARAGFT